MGKQSPLIWQSNAAFDHHTHTPTLMPPTGHRTLCVGGPHSVHFMGCTSCVDYHTYHHMSRLHSAHFMRALSMGCTLCVEYHIYHYMSRPISAHFMGAYCMGCADDPTYDYQMPYSVAMHSMNSPYVACSPLVTLIIGDKTSKNVQDPREGG